MSDEKITIDDFKKVEITIGKIEEVEIVEDADKLLKLTVDFGDEKRQIVSGIREFFVFVNDENDQNEECLLIKVQFS